MVTQPLVLTIDAGTTSIKVSLFTTRLEPVACSVQEYSLKTKGDFVEVDSSKYLQAIVAGTHEVMSKHQHYDICAIGITTQGETLALFNAQGVPLTPFIVWLDNRGHDQAREVQKAISVNTFYKETGLPEISPALPMAKVMWLKENKPKEFKKAYKILLLEDYLLYWLTGNFVSEKTVQTSTGWFSIKKDKYWRKALNIVGIKEDMLPTLLESGQISGTLIPSSAKSLNIKEGIPVVSGAMDQTAAALAAGCIKENTITETTGTALVMAACTSKPVFKEGHRVTIYRHAVKGKYLYLPIGNTAGMSLKWFRDEFCKEAQGYDAMDKLAQDSKAGSGGVIFLPYLAGSVDPINNPYAKAVFFGATLATTKADFTRSIFEGVAFMLHDFIIMLQDLGIKPQKILSLGGGARSAVWQQIKADVCQMPFATAHCTEATSQGAALLALWGVDLIPYGEIPKQELPKVYKPSKKHITTYGKNNELYNNLYKAVSPLFLEDIK